MVPQTYPSILNPYTNMREMVVKQLASTSGLQRWVDYIPMKLATSTRPAGEQTTDADGFIAINSLQDTSSGVAFKDWVPVYFDSDATDAWVVSDSGYIPVGASGGAIAILQSFGSDAHVYLPGSSGVSLSGLLTNNYTDSSGSTGYSAVDGTAGRVLDAAGSVGPELVTNGDFSDGATGWTLGAGWAVSGGVLVHTSAAYEYATFLTGAAFTEGATYRVAFTQVSGASGLNVFVKGGSASTSGGAGEKVVYVVASSSTTGFRFGQGAADTVIDNISVKQVTGIHATQATTANKPALRRGSYNQFSNSEMVGATVGVIGSGGALPTGWYSSPVSGLTTEVVSIGALSTGEKYIDIRLFGTNTSGVTKYPDIYFLPGSTGAAAAQGQTWTVSAKAAIIAGSNLGFIDAPRKVNIFYGTSGGVYLESSGAVAELTSTMARSSVTRTAGGATVGRVTGYINLGLANGATVDVTIRIAQPQLEIGATAGDYSPTTSAAASNPSAGRYSWQFDGSNDSLALGSVPFQMSDDHCVVMSVSSNSYASLLQSFYNGGSSGVARCASMFIVATTGAPTFFWRDDASVSTSLALPAMAIGEFGVVSGRKVGNAVSARKNGANTQSGSVSALGVTTVAASYIGCLQGSSNFHNGAIGPVILIKGTVSDADLLTLERWVASLTPNGPSF